MLQLLRTSVYMGPVTTLGRNTMFPLSLEGATLMDMYVAVAYTEFYVNHLPDGKVESILPAELWAFLGLCL